MNKQWYKSKTVWTAAAVFAGGIASFFGVTIPDWTFTVLSGFGLYSVRDTIGNLPVTTDKEWYKSKTIWTAVSIMVCGVAMGMGYVIPEWTYTALAGFGLYGVRDAFKS